MERIEFIDVDDIRFDVPEAPIDYDPDALTIPNFFQKWDEDDPPSDQIKVVKHVA